jgi:hypothetical protein
MTVAPVATVTIYALAGANLGPFNTVWPYAEDADVTALLDIGAGQQLLEQGVDYTLTDIPPTLTGGGEILLNAALVPVAGAWPGGAKVILSRSTAEGQPSAFGELAAFSPQATEQALDNISRQVQEIGQQLAQGLRFPFGEVAPTLPDAAQRLGTALTFDPITGALTLTILPVGSFGPFPILPAAPAMPTSWQIYIDEALGPRIWSPLDNAWHAFLVA